MHNNKDWFRIIILDTLQIYYLVLTRIFSKKEKSEMSYVFKTSYIINCVFNDRNLAKKSSNLLSKKRNWS